MFAWRGQAEPACRPGGDGPPPTRRLLGGARRRAVIGQGASPTPTGECPDPPDVKSRSFVSGSRLAADAPIVKRPSQQPESRSTRDAHHERRKLGIAARSRSACDAIRHRRSSHSSPGRLTSRRCARGAYRPGDEPASPQAGDGRRLFRPVQDGGGTVVEAMVALAHRSPFRVFAPHWPMPFDSRELQNAQCDRDWHAFHRPTGTNARSAGTPTSSARAATLRAITSPLSTSIR